MKTGFTLIELLIVMAIVGILVSIAIVGLEGAQMSSRNAIRESAISAISKDLQSYFNQNHYYPSDILFSNDSNSYNSCESQNNYFSNTTKICFGIAIAPSNGSGSRTWAVENTALTGVLSNNSGFDGYPNPGEKTASGSTQFFYFDNVTSSSNGPAPQGYIVGFCKEGGGISYLSGGRSPILTKVSSNKYNVVSEGSGYWMWGMDSVPFSCNS